MGSMLVIGAGRFGKNLAIKLTELGNEVALVDISEDAVNNLANVVKKALIGDCTDESVIASLSVHSYDVCFVCISENFQSSLEITSLLKDHGARRVVAKTDRDIHAEMLKKLSADEIIYPERDMAQRTAGRYSAHGAFDYIEISPEYAIMEVVPPADWIGRSIRELQVRTEHRINVIGVRVGDQVLPLTRGDHIFLEREHILLAGAQEDMEKWMGVD